MRSAPLLAALMLTTILSCHDPLNLPPVKGPPLSVPTRGAPDPAVPLRVLYVSPQGEADSRHIQITATFNKPVVPLAQVEKRAEVTPLRLDPAVKGSQRWLSSRTVAFTPTKPLAGSSRFSVVLAAGLKALDGTTLAAEKKWSFVTERLAVVRHGLPYQARRWAKPDQRLKLFFNQRVDAREAAAHVSFHAFPRAGGAPTTVAAEGRMGSRSRHRHRPDPRVVEIWPAAPLPLHARIEVRVKPGLVGKAGPIAMKRAHMLKFATYGPFRLKKLASTTNFPPEDTLRLSFSTPVVPKDVLAVLRVNGRRVKHRRPSRYASSSFYLPLSFQPRRRYRLTFTGPLKDRFGQKLQDVPKLVVSTGDYPAYAKLPIDSGVLEAHGPKRLPLLFRNAEGATLYHKRLSPAEIAQLADERGDAKDKPRYAKLQGAKARKLAVRRAPNKSTVVRVPLDRLVGAKARGVVALELHSTLRDRDKPQKPRTKIARSIVRITDLGLMAKYSPHTSLIWVTSLQNGKPVAACDVSIWRPGEKEPRWRGKTDKHGLARAPGALELSPKATDKLTYVFVAQKGEDLSYTLSTTQSGIRPWDFNIDETWEAGAEGYKGMVFSDRGLYRPGQSAQIKGILRRLDAKKLALVQGEVSVSVGDARGENVMTAKRELSAFGTFHLEVPIPASAPLGHFSVTVKRGKAQVARGTFRVEEYRPAEFAVQAKSEHKELIRGETMRWDISGRYLFGSAMRGAKIKTYLSWSRAFFSPPGFEGYTFSDEAPWWGVHRSTSGYVGQKRGKLDDRGEKRGARKLAPAKMFAPRRYQLEATVTDVSRQSISARTATLLHPGEFYLGVKAKERFLAANEKLDAKVIVARPNGQVVAGVFVAGTLYKREWRSVRKKGMRGATTFVTRPFETKVGSCRLRSAKRARGCAIAVPSAGYYILRLTAKDARGNPLASAMDLYAAGEGYVPWRRENSHKLELVKDRKSYRVGQVARVMIKSPFPKAHGLLTVERNGIYVQKPIVVDRSAKWVEIPITEQLVPNAFVSVMLVRGRVKVATKKNKAPSDWHHDPGKPAFKVGYIKLPIDARDRRVSVTVRPERERYRPGEEAVVDLTAKDAKGRPLQAELTVMVADEGVLSLIGYRTPNPMNIFYAARGLSVRTADNRIRLLSRRLFGEKGNKPGGGGGGHGGTSQSGVRKNFVSTPYFAPSVITDAQGKARVRFALPDNLTTFRVMAIAVTKESSFGSAQAKVEVNKPLLLLPALPRFLRVGDKLQAGVVIHNRTGKDGRASVKAEAEGLELSGATMASVQVPAGQGREARFSFVAKRPGVATLRFSASLGDHRDAVEVTKPVKLPLVVEHTATMGSTDDKAAEAVLPGDGVRDDVGGLQITLASSAMVGLRGGLDYLLEYPYECLEQSTSRMAAIAIFGPLLEAYELKKPAEAKVLLAKLLRKLEKLQRWNGGFSYWPSSSYVSPWASAYTLWGLQQAKQRGHAVSKRVLKNGARYLQQLLRRRAKSSDDEALQGPDLAEKTFIAHVLTSLGKRPDAYLNRLYEKRAKLPLFARALLLEAMAGGKSDAKALAELEREITNRVHQTGRTARVEEDLGRLYAPYFHSDTRSSAMLLSALLVARPTHPLVEKLVAGLVEARKNGRWRNTQETVYALYALHRYYESREKDVPDFVAKVVLGEKTMLERRFAGRSLQARRATTPMQSLLGRRGLLGFVKSGKGRLYYSARLSYARKELPMMPWDEGIFLTRSYERVNDKKGSFDALRGAQPKLVKGNKELTIKAGEMVRVKLRLVVPQHMHHVAIDDPLPAGLEAVNFNLMTASRSSRRHLRGRGYRSRYGGRGGWWHTPFYHRQTRDDRVQLFADSVAPGVYTYVYLTRATSMGRFVAPPAHAEQMYAPEVFGRSATRILEVRE